MSLTTYNSVRGFNTEKLTQNANVRHNCRRRNTRLSTASLKEKLEKGFKHQVCGWTPGVKV